MKSVRAASLAGIGLTALAFAAPEAYAQSTNSAAEPDVQVAAGDIVVTARRRDEALSRVPVAISVLSADAIKDAQINSEQDLRAAVVGLQVRATLSSNQLNFAIRGASQDGLSGTRPGVLPYINEVQISGSAGATAFYDLGNIQVLKGPQGTLFGRSATGGAVLYETARPTAELSGYLSGLYGSYNSVKLEGAVAGPIAGDVLQARLAGVYTRRNGFQKNILLGGREGDNKRYGFRGSLTFAPVDELENRTVVDYFHADGSSTAGVISGLLPLGAPGEPPFVPAQLLYGGANDPVARATAIAVISAVYGGALPQSTIASAYDAYFADPRHPAGGISQFLAEQKARGPFKVAIDGRNAFRSRNLLMTNTTSYELGANLKLKNIFGYYHIDTRTDFDIDGTPYQAAGQGVRGSVGRDGYAIETRAFSNEIQLQGGAADDALTYVAGLYYSREKAVNNYDSDFFDILVAPLGLPAQRVVSKFVIRNETLAPFAQGTLKLNDSGLSATAGVRYTSEKVSKERLPGDNAYGLGGDDDKSRRFRKVSWTLGLQEQLDSSTLLYVTTRRAYKSGGYNGSVALDGPAAVGGDEYDAEQVTDVELGAKYAGQLAGRPLRVSLAAFNNWLRQSQRVAFTLVGGAPSAVTVNVPRGRVRGLEGELSYSPASWLTAGGNVSLLRAKFSNGEVLINGVPLDYDRLPDTPRYAYSLFADVQVPLAGELRGLLHADLYGQGRSFTSPRSANNAGTTVRSYALLNLRAGIEDPDAGWTLIANVKNVLDKTYYVGGGSAGEIYQVNTLVPGEPRMATIEARFTF